MYDIAQFRPALYALLILGVSGFALAAQAPGIWMLAMAGIGINGWLVYTGRFRPLPRFVANVVTLAAFAYVTLQVRQLGPRSVLVIGQFLVLLQLIKLFEQRANRDYAQLIVLSLLLMVAAAINTAALMFGLMFIAYLFLSLYVCLLFHLKVETDQARAAIAMPDERMHPSMLRQDQRNLSQSMRRLTAFVSLVSVVMAIVVFLLFPRGTGAGLLGPLQFRQNQTLTGFSEQVGFQNVAKITQNDEVAAHVKLFKNDVPVMGGETLLLRGLTLDIYNGDGREGGGQWQWSRVRERARPYEVPTGASAGFMGDNPIPEGDRWRQEVTLQPTGTHALFAMPGVISYRPFRGHTVYFTEWDEALRSYDRIEQPIQYEVVSTGVITASPRPEEAPDPGGTGSGGFGYYRPPQMPRRSVIDPKIADYARRPEVCGPEFAKRNALDGEPSDLDETIANNIQNHLQNTFAYTLDLTDAKRIEGQDPVVAFLYDLKRGHCEYFAGAMTLMCQSLGIQARMVVGFKCDEFNPIVKQFVVRQAHAHAWVEVLMPDGTWKTYDPTSGRDPRQGQRQTGLFTRIKHLVDFLEYTWATKVVAYDGDSRENVVANLDRSIVNTASNAQTIFSRLPEFLEAAGLWLASKFLGPLIGLMILVVIGAIAWFFMERWRLRRRAARIGLDALPEREQIRLARQLGFYDDLIQLLERRQIIRPKHLTPQEFSETLSFLPSEVFDAVRRLTQLFYRIRFGGAELTPARRHWLGVVIDRLDRTMP
jgi:transglutaminase-like putative cysteine protease